MKQQYIDLAERCEAADCGSDDLDRKAAMLAQEERIGLEPFYPGHINYDVDLWLIRHDWSPSSSLDAAMTLLPDRHILLHLGHVHIDGDSEAVIGRSDSQSFKGDGSTPALALLAAICRAMGEG